MSNIFRIEIAKENEIPDLAALMIPTFAHFTVEAMLGNIDEPKAIEAAGQRHLRAWREHMDETGRASGIKCVASDLETGEEVLAACAYWYIFSHPRSAVHMHRPNFLLSADWVSEENDRREKLRRSLQPVIDMRQKWLKGRGHAVLMFLATDKAWRRKGAATAIVRWGLDRCRELNVPAFLEASDEGAPVYERLGFEVVDEVVMEIEGERAGFPAMMWWPPGTKEVDKRPAMACWTG
ncbi:uncharacterized protein LTR77_002016 [Saxophila tyrrhenica]|uniref:N-acetyltransferase domain-containing protein n=1 Tax=Saxophila tyrrhenica TaxID=1690608 RepID=A0AAV9PKH7_9PEZI|nr:hypothetical protein LTR77_002016 [Saxophila tyrrhenica]